MNSFYVSNVGIAGFKGQTKNLSNVLNANAEIGICKRKKLPDMQFKLCPQCKRRLHRIQVYNITFFKKNKTRDALIREYGNTCLRCGGKDTWGVFDEERALCIDHVIPLSHGGKNHMNNFQLLCYRCNSAKKDRSWDFRPKKKRYKKLSY